MATQLFVLFFSLAFCFSLSLWGSKLYQLCSGSTCSTAICIFIFTFIVADNAGLSASVLVAMNFATKNVQAAQEAGRQTERPTVFLLPYAKDSTVASQLEARASKLSNMFLPNETEMKCLFCGLACLLVVRVACHIVEPNIMTILRAGLKETQAEQSRAERVVLSAQQLLS